MSHDDKRNARLVMMLWIFFLILVYSVLRYQTAHAAGPGDVTPPFNFLGWLGAVKCGLALLIGVSGLVGMAVVCHGEAQDPYPDYDAQIAQRNKKPERQPARQPAGQREHKPRYQE